MVRNRFFFGVIVPAFFLCSTFSSSESEAGCKADGTPLPFLTTDKSVEPTVIYLPDGGIPDEAMVTLTVAGVGFPSGDTFAIDVILVMDKSGSMAGQKLYDAKSAAIYFCTLLDTVRDQSSLVSFNNTASLDQELTIDHDLTIIAIQGIVAGGNTAIGSGINVAQGELTSARHRVEAIPVMVLLSDGDNNAGPDPIVEANIAKGQGTTIFTIGLGLGANQALLQEIATDPDSEHYFYAPTSADLDSIYGRIHGEISFLVAKETYATEILSSNIHFVPGSFSISPISVSGDTSVWDLGEIEIGESWFVTFNITASDTGHLPVDDYPNAKVDYINCLNLPAAVPFPQAYIDVLSPVTRIEEDGGRRIGRGIFILVSPNPFSTSTRIDYFIQETSPVRLEIFDLTGKRIRTLVEEEKQGGSHFVIWDQKDDSGKEVSSGLYFLIFKIREHSSMEKIILLR